jgi:L-2,4-diaminobutyric acid acetyltransferase
MGRVQHKMQKSGLKFHIRNPTKSDIKEVYKLLTSNRPYVGLNSRYTYFLLARDFSDTCLIAEHNGEIVAFSSGYIPPRRQDTFFSWEIVVRKDFRGNGLQRLLLLNQLKKSGVKYIEGTVNPSNPVSKSNFQELATYLNTNCNETPLFSEEDFENDGHEAEVLLRVGPISNDTVERINGASGCFSED